MKTIITILTVAILLPLSALAQKEDRVWVFAESKIDFNTNPPTVTQCGTSYSTADNITSVADRNGNLVYWLNATSLYNRNDEVIFTLPKANEYDLYFYGLSIVPFPGKENVYMFIYPDAKHSIMTISLADGSQDLLHPTITERYAEYPYYTDGPDGILFFLQRFGSRDYWMLYTHRGIVDVYAITKDGITNTNQTYKLPTSNGKIIGIYGCEMTPDRSKILTNGGLGEPMCFIDIDNKTGKIKSANLLSEISLQSYAFAPDNKYLYFAAWITKKNGLYRVPIETLSTMTEKDYLDNKGEWISDIDFNISDMKYLTDRELYFVNEDDGGWLGMVANTASEHPVTNPKAIKLAKNLKDHDVINLLSLPKTYCYPFGFTYDIGCGGNVQFGYYQDNDYESLVWDFGDGQTADIPYPQHTYKSNGSYTVTLTVRYPNQTEEVIKKDIHVNTVMKKLTIVAE